MNPIKFNPTRTWRQIPESQHSKHLYIVAKPKKSEVLPNKNPKIVTRTWPKPETWYPKPTFATRLYHYPRFEWTTAIWWQLTNFIRAKQQPMDRLLLNPSGKFDQPSIIMLYYIVFTIHICTQLYRITTIKDSRRTLIKDAPILFSSSSKSKTQLWQ